MKNLFKKISLKKIKQLMTLKSLYYMLIIIFFILVSYNVYLYVSKNYELSSLKEEILTYQKRVEVLKETETKVARPNEIYKKEREILQKQLAIKSLMEKRQKYNYGVSSMIIYGEPYTQNKERFFPVSVRVEQFGRIPYYTTKAKIMKKIVAFFLLNKHVIKIVDINRSSGIKLIVKLDKTQK